MKRAGINVIAGFDTDEKAGRIYSINNKASKFFKRDIRDLKGSEILKLFEAYTGKRILAGCAPCQPFSRINRDGGRGHKNYELLNEFSRLIIETLPDGVIMENVSGLASDGKSVFNRFLDALKSVGLNATYDDKMDAASYGVPQHRKRLVLIASRAKPSLPVKTHGLRTGRPYVNVRDKIGNLPPIEAGHRDNSKFNHSCKALSPLNLIRIITTPHDGGSRTDLPAELWIKSHKDHKGHGDTYGRMKWDSPAPTLTCRCITISNGRFAHPEQDRGISVREAALLQTFRKKYIFPSNLQDAQRCIGNAVPPLLAEKVAKQLLKSI